MRSNEYNQKCAAKFWDPNSLREECPSKRCTKNQDCWEEYGESKLCICDPHLCGLVCMSCKNSYIVHCPTVDIVIHWTRWYEMSGTKETRKWSSSLFSFESGRPGWIYMQGGLCCERSKKTILPGQFAILRTGTELHGSNRSWVTNFPS